VPISFPTSFDTPRNNSVKTVASGAGYFGLDGNDSLFSSPVVTTFADGSLWGLPSNMSGGKGDDKYYVGYDDFAVIADAGFGNDYLRLYRPLSEIIWAARIDGRHLAAAFEAFPGSAYSTKILIVDAFKPEGSIEATEFDSRTVLNTSYDQLPSLLRSSGINVEELSWEQAIGKKYLNLSVLGVANNSSGAAELMDLAYRTGNPVTQAGVHRFFNPSKGVHFYTNDLNEVNSVRSRLGNYQYEGKVYDTVTDTEAGNTQLYRFFNPKASYHFMTTSAMEAATVVNNPSWGYVSEGRSFSVSTAMTAFASSPVYRFYRVLDGVGQHFYTSSEAERQNILNNPSWGYQAEGVGWYAS
jgi:hypothetical protein